MNELAAISITLQLAAITSLGLLLCGTPLAWWLAHHAGTSKPYVEALTAMPLVLPPTVLGFYLLILFNPESFVGGLWLTLTDQSLTFSFSGLVVASMIYSLPFMVQPLQNAFEQVGQRPLEAAATLGAGRWDSFFNVALPMSKRGFVTALILTFAHTVGEFGVVLMVGGNIPGETRLLSIAIYENVETLDYAQAHILSGGLIVFSFVTLFVVYALNGRFSVAKGA